MINNDFLYKDFYEMLKKMIKKVCYHYIKKINVILRVINVLKIIFSM